jgi:hypothetical protein
MEGRLIASVTGRVERADLDNMRRPSIVRKFDEWKTLVGRGYRTEVRDVEQK